MKLCLKALLFLCLLSFTTIIFAQECVSEKVEIPEWTKGRTWRGPKSIITVVKGVGINHKDAKKNAEVEIGKAVASFIGLDCIVKDGKLTSCDDAIYRTVAYQTLRESEPIVTVRKRDGRCVNEYTVYLLVQLPKDLGKSELFDEVYDSDQYPFSGRVFVPGMAQIYKGQNVKGALFITGEVLFIGGIAASFGMSSYYKSKRNSTHDSGQKQSYTDWANYAGYAGWGFVGAAAALYIANIIDGIVSPGKPALFDKNGKKIVFAPTASPYSFGLAMNLNF